MSKKHKHQAVSLLSLDEIKARATRALREGRSKQALELAKQIYKAEPNSEHEKLLRVAYLGRARQLRAQGNCADALAVLQVASQYGQGDREWLSRLAEEFASCGDVQRALKIVQKLPASATDGKGGLVPGAFLERAVDRAMQQGEEGRKLLTEPLQREFDCIVDAFAQLENKQDDLVRETLQGIGLRSPFLEWKLLIRGLQAYYQQDDARALENWQRLQADRLPARLAAPFRLLIDPAFRRAQAVPAQTALQRQADRLLGSGVVPFLRSIQTNLASQQALSAAFRQAETLLPTLRAEAPHAVPRLAASFFWTIVNKGRFEDVLRFKRIFGAPPEDPNLDRLHALAAEHIGDFSHAHEHWQRFERAVAVHPELWPGDQANRVRALIWNRMGHNAVNAPDAKSFRRLPPFLRSHLSPPEPLSPSAEMCFRRSLELAPDRLASHESLFLYFKEHNKTAKAINAAQDLLERFPDHVPTLEALGNLYMEQGKYGDALDVFQRALCHNPMDRRLRSRISTAHVFNARAHAELGRFDEARAEYQCCLAYDELGESRSSILCKWAACEFKAKNPAQAEELLRDALSVVGCRLAVAYSMLIEVIRLKLPPALKSRFNKDFNAALAEPPTGAGAVAIAATAGHHIRAGIKYHGQKTHEKKVQTYLEKALRAGLTEQEMEHLGAELPPFKRLRLVQAFSTAATIHFPNNPALLLAEAECYLELGLNYSRLWRIRNLLTRARVLLERMPFDPKYKDMLGTVQKKLAAIEMINPFMRGDFASAFEEMINQFNCDDAED